MIQERELGAKHPATALTLGDLGEIRRLAGDTASAQSYYERALDVFLKCHGADHHRTRWVLEQLATLTSSS